jgi:hypothetical protein
MQFHHVELLNHQLKGPLFQPIHLDLLEVVVEDRYFDLSANNFEVYKP